MPEVFLPEFFTAKFTSSIGAALQGFRSRIPFTGDGVA
jgi:hypothetical protein